MSTQIAPAVRVVALIRRKPGTTREEFIEHYENHHARLIAGHKYKWLADYTRNYVIPGTEIQKLDGDDGSLPDCDVITIASFNTVEDYEAFTRASSDPEFQRAVVADEESFMDRDSIRFFRVDAHVTDLDEFGAPAVGSNG
ncbi:EthD domain-containing protein [Nocardia sp. R6R-6]|uniref:EthD domain-containing protein n=1 Tax=Nocardia sp. R6R-6 TaxID=3459303 RepID=UPI00403E1949